MDLTKFMLPCGQGYRGKKALYQSSKVHRRKLNLVGSALGLGLLWAAGTFLSDALLMATPSLPSYYSFWAGAYVAFPFGHGAR